MVEDWAKVVFRPHRVPIFRRIPAYLVVMGLYTAGVELLEHHILTNRLILRSSELSVIGIVLGLLLVFRTNTAYDRWWEGRKLWGQLVNESRNLCLKTNSFLVADVQARREMYRCVIGFPIALKEHLRKGIALQSVPGFEHETEQPAHVPGYIAGRVLSAINLWKLEGRIDGFAALKLDQHARAYMDVCGACERIRRTPLASSHQAFIRQCIAIYLFSLPWVLVLDFHYWSIPIVLIATYFMVGVELIAEDIEEPFGHDGDDLRLDEICATIARSAEEMLHVSSDQDSSGQVG